VPKRQSRVERRRQILDAARRVFGRSGFGSTPMIEVARAAGVGKGTLYEYFSSKEELFTTLILNVAREALETMRRTLPNEEPEAALGEAIDLTVRVALTENVDIYRLYLDFAGISDAHRRRARNGVRETAREFRDFFARLIRRGQESGAFRADLDADVVARSFLASVDGIGTQVVLLDEPLDAAEYAATLRSIYFGALRAEPAIEGASILKERE
jgi:AcrR family transcriptional regulator